MESDDIRYAQKIPKELSFEERTFKEINLGGSHSSLITRDLENIDHLYIWVNNEKGQQGLGSDETNIKSPQEVVLPIK